MSNKHDEGREEWHASPKPKKPLSERLDSLSNKILREQLAKERELRKELVEILIRIKPLAEDGHTLHKKNGCHQEFLSEDLERLEIVEALIKKGT